MDPELLYYWPGLPPIHHTPGTPVPPAGATSAARHAQYGESNMLLGSVNVLILMSHGTARMNLVAEPIGIMDLEPVCPYEARTDIGKIG